MWNSGNLDKTSGNDDTKLIERFCRNDMQVKDRMQNEMLRTLLKRIIISVTPLARNQITYSKLDIMFEEQCQECSEC